MVNMSIIGIEINSTIGCTCRIAYKILVVGLSVCPCVCDGCGHGRNEFAGRVQNHHVRFSFHRNGDINLS